MSNLPLLTIGDYYYHSHDKMVKSKWRPGMDMVWVFVGVIGCVPRPTGLSLVTVFFMFVLIKDRPLLWMVVRSILSTYLLMGAGRLITFLSWVLALSGPIDWRRGKVKV